MKFVQVVALLALLVPLLAAPPLLPATGAPAAAAPMLAVLGLDAASRELADDIETRLLEHGDCRLVDRQQLDLVFREREMSALEGGPAVRTEVGRLIRADMLILVGLIPEAEGGGVRSIVCDVATGARLAQGRWTPETASPQALVRQALDVLARFPDGVTTIIAIPDFLSRDLLLRYEHLQTDLAEVLRQSLADVPGLALVEVEEAKSISAEMELTSERAVRTLRLHVEGEYRTDALAEGGPTITIQFSVSDGTHAVMALESGVIPLAQAGRFVGVTTHDRLRQALRLPPQEGLDANTQFRQLITRADAFAKIGDFARSAALREAALLLNPDDVPQRVRLVQDYNRSCNAPIIWRRSLLHVETLIRNRRVNSEQGTRLFYDTLRSLFRFRATKSHLLVEEERMKKEFIRAVMPTLVAGSENVKELADRAVEMTLLRMDNIDLGAEDLDLLADLLCEILPAETPVFSRLLYRLRDGTGMYGQGFRLCPAADAWLAFLVRLKKSPRPQVRLYGRYGELCDRRYRQKDASDETLMAAKTLAADVRAAHVAALDPSQFLVTATRDEVAWLGLARARTRTVRLPEITPPPAQEVAKPTTPVLQPDGSLLCDRVRLVPLPLRVLDERDNSDRPLEGHRWRAAGGWSGWKSLVPAWEGVDAVFASGALLLVDAKLVARPILVDPEIRLSHVVFDGRHLWAASGCAGGLYVYDRQGAQVAHVTEAHGLPPAFFSMPILVLGEGRIMATGMIGGEGGRGWIATVELRSGKPSVRVIHEAVDAVQNFWDLEEQKNPRRRFEPDWIIGHRDEDGRQWVFVNRRNHPFPLMVDVATGTVTVYPARAFDDRGGVPRNEEPKAAFLSRAGELHGAAGCWVEHDGWLYSAGNTRWMRRNVMTGVKDVLVDDVRMLPDHGSGWEWRLANSRAFGLVAWINGKLFRVVPPDVPPNSRKTQ